MSPTAHPEHPNAASLTHSSHHKEAASARRTIKAVALVLARHEIRSLRRWFEDFDRDILLPILLGEIAAQERDHDLWQHLNGLIGSADGAKFRKFAQGLTLDHLIHLANRQLTRLHGRYQLARKSSGELELEVRDTWQADVARGERDRVVPRQESRG